MSDLRKLRSDILDAIMGRPVTAGEFIEVFGNEAAMTVIEDGISEASAEYSINAMLSIRDKARYGKNAASPDS